MGLPKFTHMYRLTRQPELTFSGAGMAICKIGLACSEKYKEKETQLFIDATAFNKTAEILANVQKGHRILVSGKISTDSWEDASSGQKRSKTVMIIESFEFIEPKDQSQQQGNYNQDQNNQNQGGFQNPQDQQQHGNNNGFQQNPPF